MINIKFEAIDPVKSDDKVKAVFKSKSYQLFFLGLCLLKLLLKLYFYMLSL